MNMKIMEIKNIDKFHFHLKKGALLNKGKDLNWSTFGGSNNDGPGSSASRDLPRK